MVSILHRQSFIVFLNRSFVQVIHHFSRCVLRMSVWKPLQPVFQPLLEPLVEGFGLDGTTAPMAAWKKQIDKLGVVSVAERVTL